MLIGYARVSTAEQNLDLQTDALRTAGCERLFTDTVSGATVDRPGLDAALTECRPGDTLVVWKLDRLGRSLPHLVDIVRDLGVRGVWTGPHDTILLVNPLAGPIPADSRHEVGHRLSRQSGPKAHLPTVS